MKERRRDVDKALARDVRKNTIRTDIYPAGPEPGAESGSFLRLAFHRTDFPYA